MAQQNEIPRIMEMADKYQDYFNEWHSDIAIGRKGPHFFYVYNDRYHNFEVFTTFETAEELEKLIIGTMADNMETVNAVVAEDLHMKFDEMDINENIDIYDPDCHIHKLFLQVEAMTEELRNWTDMVTSTYRSLANVCKDMIKDGKQK